MVALDFAFDNFESADARRLVSDARRLILKGLAISAPASSGARLAFDAQASGRRWRSLRSLAGIARTQITGVSLEDMERAIAVGAAETMTRARG